MTTREKQLIRESFPVIREEAGPISLLFYGRLFEESPQLRTMFHGDISRQGLKLMDMLAAVVDSLDRIDSLTPTLQAMGQRHAAYGVAASHYDTVEQAFAWALSQALATERNAELIAAWRTVIREVSGVMKTGANRLDSAPA